MSAVPPPQLANLRGAVDLSPLVNRPPAAAGAGASGGAGQPANVAPTAQAGGAPIPVPSLVLEGTDANFTQFLELSSAVPLIVDLWAEWCEPCKELSPIIERLVQEYAGRLLLVTVDVDANPQLTQAFQAQSIPTVAAVVGGRPVSLFVGALPEEQVRAVFEQVLALAEQNGVTGTVVVEGAPAPEAGAAPEPVEAPLPPHHAEAYAAIEKGDYETAIAEYKIAIAQDPRDQMAVAGLAQVSLLARLSGKTLESIRGAAAAAPEDLEAQLDVADLDLSGGHIDDAFDRLLTLFPKLDQAEKNTVRQRLLEMFEVVGVEDPRVAAARKRLTALLY